jgi:hypothetical protein
MELGQRCAARTKGSVVEAKDESEEGRKDEKEDARGGVCARYDSRPLLKAKAPRGRAESERRRRKWVGEPSAAARNVVSFFVRLEWGFGA